MSVAGVRCDLSAADMEFRTALHWAAVLGSSDMLSLLVQGGSPILAADSVGATPLHYAVSVPLPLCSLPSPISHLPSSLLTGAEQPRGQFVVYLHTFNTELLLFVL